jgi:hypothetical protein
LVCAGLLIIHNGLPCLAVNQNNNGATNQSPPGVRAIIIEREMIALRSRQVRHSFDPSESDRIKPTCWWKPHPLFLLFPPVQMGYG